MKTSELTGRALDWAVIQAEHGDANTLAFIGENRPRISESWATCGPIIEREAIQLIPDSGATYVECVWFAKSANDNGDEFNGEGPTPLVAAMRCYVASKLGDEVEIPQELV